MRVAATVKPGSKQPGIGIEGGTLVVRVRERAVESAANQACVRALARALHVAPSQIALLRGARSREKLFLVDGLDEAEGRKRLGFGAES